MTTEDQVTRDHVIEKLAALLAAWEQGFVSNPDDAEYGVNRIRQAGDEYVEALAAFIDSRAKEAVLSLREPSSVVAPPFTGEHE